MTPTSPPHAKPADLAWTWREAALLGCLLLLVAFLAWPGMTAELLLDDKESLAHVRKFTSWKDAFKPDCFGVLRPAKGLLLYHFHLNGLPSLGVIHGLVLAMYLGATASIHLLFRHLNGSWRWGLVATCLWTTCATQVSTAVWFSCINISLAILLASPAILFHQRSWIGNTGRNLCLSALFLFLSLASYETALCIAPACVLVDLLRGRNIFSKPALGRYLALGVTTLFYLALRASFGASHDAHTANVGFDPEMPAWQLVVSAPWLLWRHFSMWMMPFGRIEFVSTFVWGLSAPLWEIIAAWGFLLALVAIIFLARKKIPLLAFGIAFYLAASFPTSNFIPIWAGPVEDYYVVFPSIGLAIALVGIARALLEWSRQPSPSAASRSTAAISLLSIMLVWRAAAMALFWHQADLWNDPIKLYLSNMETRPGQFNNKTLVARELLVAGEYKVSKELALESALEAPWQQATYSILGEIAIKEGDDELALQYFDKCKERLTQGSLLHFANLRKAAILMKTPERRPEARQALLQILPDPTSDYHYDATRALASLYYAEGDTDKAILTLEKSLAIHPGKAAELKAAILSVRSPESTSGPGGKGAGSPQSISGSESPPSREAPDQPSESTDDQ
jgi:tetratricopeptide (TPR) repeat protein